MERNLEECSIDSLGEREEQSFSLAIAHHHRHHRLSMFSFSVPTLLPRSSLPRPNKLVVTEGSRSRPAGWRTIKLPERELSVCGDGLRVFSGLI